MLAVGVAHLVEEIRLDGALKPVVRAADNLNLDVELIEQTLVKHYLRCHSVDVEHAVGVEIDLIACCGEVISALRQCLAVGEHKFARFLETCDMMTQLLDVGRRSACRRELEEDSGDVVVVFRSVDIGDNVVQA